MNAMRMCSDEYTKGVGKRSDGYTTAMDTCSDVHTKAVVSVQTSA